MDKTNFVKLLSELNDENLLDCTENFEDLIKNKFDKIIESLSTTFEEVKHSIREITQLFQCNIPTYEWKYICLNFNLLKRLDCELNKSELNILSVQDIKTVKTCIQRTVTIGISKNLQEKLPNHLNIDPAINDSVDLIYNYNILKCTTFGFYLFMKSPNLRMLILPSLQPILTAIYQISYSPLRKPSNVRSGNFEMTPEIYEKLMEDQGRFSNYLADLQQKIHPTIYVKETMILFQASAPNWFKKSISNTLTRIIRSERGVERISLAMLDGADDDQTKNWQILEVLTKLIVSCRKFEDFRTNICKQVVNLLDATKNSDSLLIFERLVICCAKHLSGDEQKPFVDRILGFLLKFVDYNYKFGDPDDVSEEIKQSVRLIYGTFIDDSVHTSCLDLLVIKPVIVVIFQFYTLTINRRNFTGTNKELQEILTHYFDSQGNSLEDLFDSFLFGFNSPFRNDIIIEVDERILVRNSEIIVVYATINVANHISKLLKTNKKLILFGYLLSCVINKEKYFLTENRSDLLNLEDDSPVLTRLLIIHKLLSELADDKALQKSLSENPDQIINYFNNVLTKNAGDPETIFTIIMVLDNLITTCSSANLNKYKILIGPIEGIRNETGDVELKEFCTKILETLQGNAKVKPPDNGEEMKSALDMALNDVCDPLLPTRGHGLMTLARLVGKKDKNTMEHRQYIFNLFQIHLKNEDSFIYLSAIRGLAAMADVFPDAVLNVLCEEYADYNRKTDDGHEVRMKLGEVLVRTSKILGELAPKYKSLLLNTFLTTTKDDDHLLRASSLSNLGEICRLLGYKLGTIVTEVLVCVHAVIATDKAVEARRAAVTVVRQLFAGLESEMLAFLKDDILPIYRTLKEIYRRDADDIMRLQAQLALEELNANMHEIIVSKPQLHFEKNAIRFD